MTSSVVGQLILKDWRLNRALLFVPGRRRPSGVSGRAICGRSRSPLRDSVVLCLSVHPRQHASHNFHPERAQEADPGIHHEPPRVVGSVRDRKSFVDHSHVPGSLGDLTGLSADSDRDASYLSRRGHSNSAHSLHVADDRVLLKLCSRSHRRIRRLVDGSQHRLQHVILVSLVFDRAHSLA